MDFSVSSFLEFLAALSSFDAYPPTSELTEGLCMTTFDILTLRFPCEIGLNLVFGSAKSTVSLLEFRESASRFVLIVLKQLCCLTRELKWPYSGGISGFCSISVDGSETCLWDGLSYLRMEFVLVSRFEMLEKCCTELTFCIKFKL